MTPEKFNKIVEKLPKGKTELTKVELSIASDIRKKFSDVDKLSISAAKTNSDLSKLIKEANGLIKIIKSRGKDADKLAKALNKEEFKVKELQKKAKEAAADLGVSPKDIKDYTLLDDTLFRIKESINESSLAIIQSKEAQRL